MYETSDHNGKQVCGFSAQSEKCCGEECLGCVTFVTRSTWCLAGHELSHSGEEYMWNQSSLGVKDYGGSI